jgi:hypothetical protein
VIQGASGVVFESSSGFLITIGRVGHEETLVVRELMVEADEIVEVLGGGVECSADYEKQATVAVPAVNWQGWLWTGLSGG